MKKAKGDIDFNPRSRVGNDVSGSRTEWYEHVFQSTFPRGERPRKLLRLSTLLYFNPRSRVGNDGDIFLADAEHLKISIHVPAWGTTTTAFYVFDVTKISIHVPAWGTTATGEDAVSKLDKFQSTFPRGERPAAIAAGLLLYKFQSTFPRGERRVSKRTGKRASSISIHVPAWGTTNCHSQIKSMERISIHVPAWGTTKKDVSIKWGILISIHVPAWGTTANFHKYSLLFYAINIIFLLFIIPSLFSLVLFVLLF